LSCFRVVYRVEKIKSFDGGYLRERSWFQVIQKIFRVFQNPHVIYVNTRVNSFTICLLSLFYCRQNLCFTYRYIDDILSINNSRFAEFLPLIYPPELEVKETTDTASSASFLALYLEFDDSGQISTKIYDKRDDFNFRIINFPNMCSNIPASPAYGVYISQLIRYARANSNYSDFLNSQSICYTTLIKQFNKQLFHEWLTRDL
jgi:hypothetical protein